MASEGDPRVLLVMNLVLSFVFSTAVIGGLEFIGVLEFSWRSVAWATAGLATLTFLVVLR